MIFDKINKWIIQFKPYFFTYSNGFFKFYYLANSPELIVNSIKKMPFVDFDETKEILSLNNSFLKSTLRYAELEKGLWVLNSRIFYKNNITYEAFYDASLPSNYYCLTINFIQNEYSSVFYKFDKYTISNQSINFLKPQKECDNFHFKGSFESQYVIYFDEEWMEKNIRKNPNVAENFLKLLHNEEIGFATFNLIKSKFDKISTDFITLFDEDSVLNIFKLKLVTHNFFDLFLSSFDEFQVLDIHTISNKDRALIDKVERYLMANIYEKFLGIEQLAIHFNVSSTKLKSDFKKVHGTSIFTFFQTKQMELAYHIISKDKLKIKEVAALFQYENASKFAKTFKKVYNILPSEISK